MPVLKLLIIDDDANDRMAVARAVKSLGANYELHEATSSRQGVELSLTGAFDCILVDYNMPQMNGLDILLELHKRLKVAIPIVMLTGSGSETVAVEAMKRGASDYLPKEHMEAATLLRVLCHAMEKCSLQTQLEEAQHKVERLALYDSLTGLGNRNLFQIDLTRAIAISKRNSTSFFLLMMDLDKFKMVNDTFGHETGDALLAEVGRRLSQISRAADGFYRLGGDEFMAILNVGSDGKAAAARIKAAVAAPFTVGSHIMAVEVSVGLANFPADGTNGQDLVRAADATMYAAKKSKLGCGSVVEWMREDRANEELVREEHGHS